MSIPSLRDKIFTEDIGHIRRILTSTGFFTAEEVAVAQELARERLAKGAAASGYHFLVLQKGGSPVAFACYGPIPFTDRRFDLYWIAVENAFRGLGLGGVLLTEVEARIRQAGGARIYVDTAGRAQYASTRAFYASRGYEVAAVLPDYYRDGDDKVSFIKLLEQPKAVTDEVDDEEDAES